MMASIAGLCWAFDVTIDARPTINIYLVAIVSDGRRQVQTSCSTRLLSVKPLEQVVIIDVLIIEAPTSAVSSDSRIRLYSPIAMINLYFIKVHAKKR